MAFITFLTANVGAIVAIITALVTVAGLIAKLTPTPKDDAITAKVLNFLNLLPTGAKQALSAGKDENKPSGPTPIMGE